LSAGDDQRSPKLAATKAGSASKGTGMGWTMARDLKPGDTIRTLGGLAGRVEPDDHREVGQGLGLQTMLLAPERPDRSSITSEK
jgi:hypothetical protein